MEDRQHDGPVLHQEGGRTPERGTPGVSGEDPSPGSPASIQDPAHLYSIEGEHLADAASRFQAVQDWHLSPKVFARIRAVLGLPQIDLFASCASTQLKRFFSWSVQDHPEAIDALSQKWDFNLAYSFPPVPLLRKVAKKLEMSRGTFLIVTSYWESQTWFASLLSLKGKDICRLPFRPNLIMDLTTGDPPPILEALHLVVWKICRSVEASTLSALERLVYDGWRESTEDRYGRAWQFFKRFLQPSAISFHQATVTNVADYLSHLLDIKLQWSTINSHRSAFSETLALMDGKAVGKHPVILKLMKGIFNRRPTKIEIPNVWDSSRVLNLFQHWPIPLTLCNLIKKGAFLLIIVSARTPHELAVLFSSPPHLQLIGDSFRIG
jgi:hypothetical protein